MATAVAAGVSVPGAMTVSGQWRQQCQLILTEVAVAVAVAAQ